jgi:[ribosomal protein S18]-alanine N-acetyltransferase
VIRRFEPISGESTEPFVLPLSALHRVCFPEEPWEPQEMAKIMAIAGFFGRIAWEHDQPAGLALALDLGGECEILALGVVPELRRAGIGSALLASIREEARRRGARQVFLEVAADNIAARALYAAQGFNQIGRRLNYYRRPAGPVDALVLSSAATRVSAST